jgi:hypothetical protein
VKIPRLCFLCLPRLMTPSVHLYFTQPLDRTNFTPYILIEIMTIILLVIIVILNVAYVFMINPFVGRASKESKRVAQLMSSLPDEMDVETLVIEANGLLDEEGMNADGKDKKEEENKKKKRKQKVRKERGENIPRGGARYSSAPTLLPHSLTLDLLQSFFFLS